jgi:hypothetical protein
MRKRWDIYEVRSGFAVEDRFTAKRHSYHRTLEGAEKALGRLQAKGAAGVTSKHPTPKPKPKKPKPKARAKAKPVQKTSFHVSRCQTQMQCGGSKSLCSQLAA